MIRQYRELEQDEFFVVSGDCAQGGIDSNIVQVMSKDRADVPIVLEQSGVAAGMTPILHTLLEYIYDVTGVQPVVALERNMGGASEMERLRKMNMTNKYRLYTAKDTGGVNGEKNTKILGYSTNSVTRPKMLGELKEAIDAKQLTIYDKKTIDELGTFIVNRNGKPEAAANTHDDHVMSLAIAWQLYQTEQKPDSTYGTGSYTNEQSDITRLWT